MLLLAHPGHYRVLLPNRLRWSRHQKAAAIFGLLAPAGIYYRRDDAV